MSGRYLLDTNIVSYLIRGHSAVVGRITGTPMERLAMSAETEAELLYGLARRPEATRLKRAVDELLVRVEVLDWNRAAAASFATLRSAIERDGRALDAFDLMIAAHARSIDAVLVTADAAFSGLPSLVVEDWTSA